MASLVGRLAVSVKDTVKPSHFDNVYRLGSSLRIFRNDYCTGNNADSQLATEEIDEDELNRIRDVSGLSDTLKATLHGQMPPNFGERSQHSKKHYRQSLFCRLGTSTGFDPGSMWPSQEEMQVMIKDQAKYERSVAQMMEKVEKAKQRKEFDDRRREKRISEQMAKMPQLIADFHMRSKQKEELMKKQAEKKARLLIEAQEYFGFSVDPRDEKFKQMVAEKEAAEKKEAKQRKKAEKLAKMTAQLGQ